MFQFPAKLKTLSYVLIAIGVVAMVYGFLSGGGHEAADHGHGHDNRPWASLLINNFFFLGISLGALFFLAVQYAANVGWSAGILRLLEGISGFLPFAGIIMVVIVLSAMFHMNHLYHWTAEGIMDPESDYFDSIIYGKKAYLNEPFFIIRTLVYILGWVWAAVTLRKLSLRGDQSTDLAWYKKSITVSAIFLVFFAVTSSTAAWDWIMSIDTHWFSTLFGWYVFAGIFVSALTTTALIAIYLKNNGYLEWLNKSHIHDLGKFMFAFSIFWTYLWFSQFMLIWYSNIPEEVTYYMPRFSEYKGLFMTMLVMNFLFPLLILMSRDSKRNFGFLATIGVVLIMGHWLNVYIMVTPGTVGLDYSIGFTEIGVFLGFLGGFILVVFNRLAKAPLRITNHPMNKESEYFHI
ncbi:MAG: quinol:cytochrome C oxidoreductase [Cryomorphaceae bacterium]|nr:quinol:cytochrome C oxidoreductase [Cryomorphaceae bacterium]